MTELRDAAMISKAWPFEEARRLLKRYEKARRKRGMSCSRRAMVPAVCPISAPSARLRTTMVRRAFEVISDIPTRLICFSDDMDGLGRCRATSRTRNRWPRTCTCRSPVRDPFGTHDSFGAHNNARLNAFLDSYGFEYEFASSTEYYASGRFDEMLLTALERFDKILDIMLPTLGEERRATYSPFLPVSPKTGHVLQVPTLERNVAKGTIVYEEPDGERVEIPVTGGHVKMQWKPDWAMRWAALGVDYEMSGKDLIDSVTQATKICRALGRTPPETLTYELFNDEHGQKISKSKGNGLSMEEWLTYAAPESLQYFMFQKPKTAKRLYFDVIPKAVDEYHQQLRAYAGQDAAQKLANPVFHIHGHNVPGSNMVVSFAMLLNLASVAHAEDKAALWGFIQRYAPDASPQTHPDLDAAAGFAVRYYNDFVKPTKVFRAPTDQERAAMEELSACLGDADKALNVIARKNAQEGKDADLPEVDWQDEEFLQSVVFAIGKTHGFEPLRAWFSALYEVLMGASQGPRFGGFIALYGIEETRALIADGLAGRLMAD
jgi:lysyl-tRNA synthetase class 1